MEPGDLEGAAARPVEAPGPGHTPPPGIPTGYGDAPALAPGNEDRPLPDAPGNQDAPPLVTAPGLQGVGASKAGGAPGRRRSRARRIAVEWLAVIVLALGIAVVLRTYVVQSFYIPSGSMEPTLMPGDRILVQKMGYHLARFDMVVFHRPPDMRYEIKYKDLVKRIIGLPGDTISSANGEVYIDGKPLAEPFLPRGTVTTGIRTQVIPKGYYFVMGDNRTDSLDSRYFGPISAKWIVGKVVLRFWPLGAFHAF